MVTTKYIKTKEHRKNISLGMKGKHNSINTEFKKGCSMSDKTKKRMSIRMLNNRYCLGKKASKETRDKMSATKKRMFKEGNLFVPSPLGKHLSNETKAKIGLSNKGKTRSDELKKKISLSHKGKPLSK